MRRRGPGTWTFAGAIDRQDDRFARAVRQMLIEIAE
jgi:hypothetical protein